MKKGFGLIMLLLGLGLFVVAGSGIASAMLLKKDNGVKQNNHSLENGKSPQKQQSDSLENIDPEPSPFPQSNIKDSPQAQENNKEATKTGALKEEVTLSTTFEEPGKLYKITLPAGWVVTGTFATTSYSTTTFSGSGGNISITFGEGKDPPGGCSDPIALTLADRIIPACFLLKKDGSRMLSRGYTKSSGNLKITIEGYSQTPLSTNEQAILAVAKTIDIN